MLSVPRSSIVFHELAENYYRTHSNVDYQGKTGAHQLAIDRENKWHMRSITLGGAVLDFRPKQIREILINYKSKHGKTSNKLGRLKILMFVFVSTFFLQCKTYKQTDLVDRAIVTDDKLTYVTWDASYHAYMVTVPQLGLFIPEILVEKYKKSRKAATLKSYVSYRTIFGIRGSKDFKIQETRYDTGFIIQICERVAVNGAAKYLPKITIAENKARFVLKLSNNTDHYLVLYLPNMKIGRLYRIADLYSNIDML